MDESQSETNTRPEPEPPTSNTIRHPKRLDRDLTQGSIPKHLWFLAWPQLTQAVLGVLDQIADLVWVGRLGFQAIAGLGVVQAYIMVTTTFRSGVEVAARATIARAIGARQMAYANHILLQSMTITGAFAVSTIILGWTFSEPMLRVFGLSDNMVSLAVPYMRIQFLAMAVWGFHSLTGGTLQASGDPITPLKAETISRVAHLVLSPILIFGWLGMPSLELAGAATASLIARILGLVLNLHALSSGSSQLRLRLRDYRFDGPLIWTLLKIGMPASVTDLQRGLSRLAFIGIVASFGATAVAAFTLARRAELVAMQAGQAIGRAAGALAGQNLGAHLPERAKMSVWWATAYVGLTSLVLTLLILAFPIQIASFINSDPEFIDTAAPWLRVIALGYFAVAGVFVLVNTLNSTGQTIIPMIVALTLTWGVEIPLAFALPRFTSLDHMGIPSAILVGTTIRFIILAWYVSRGRWLRTGVI